MNKHLIAHESHKLFEKITILKGIHALLTLLLGIALLILSKDYLSSVIVFLVKIGLAGDINGFIAKYITEFGINLTLGIKLFFAIYFIAHGTVGLSLVYGIIKKPSAAYPISLVVLIGFLVYQTYDYFLFYSIWILLITLFDIFFIGLLFYEYNYHLRTHSFLGKIKLIATAKVPKIVTMDMPKIKIRRIIPRIIPNILADSLISDS